MKFIIYEGYDRDDGERFYIDDYHVMSTNYDEHGSSGMEAVREMFKDIANHLKVSIEHRELTDLDEE